MDVDLAPILVTLKLALCPSVTVASAGCAVMPGAARLTVSAASALVTLPAPLLTTTLYSVPSSAAAAVKRYAAAVVPEMFAPFLRHW